MDNRKYLFCVLRYFAAYFALAELGHLLSFGSAEVASCWPPTGLYIGVLIVTPFSRWHGYIAASCIANFISDIFFHDVTPQLSLLFCLCGTFEATLAAWALRYFTEGRFQFSDMGSLLKYIATTLAVGTNLSSLLTTFAMSISGVIAWEFAIDTWLFLWLADSVGALMFGPLVISLAETIESRKWPNRQEIFEGVIITGLLSAALTLAFSPVANDIPSVLRQPLPIIPCVLWAGIRFSVKGATWATCIVVICAVAGTVNGIGPFSDNTLPQSVQALAVQIFSITICATSISFAIIYSDLVSSRKKYRENFELLDGVLKNTSNAIYAKDDRGRFILANPVACRMLGRVESEIIGNSEEDLFPQRKSEIREEQEREQRVLVNDEIVQFNSVRHLAGKRRYGKTTLSQLVDSTGNIQGVLGVWHDLTDILEAEEKERESHRRLQVILESLPVMVWLADENNSCTYFNQRWLDFSGRSMEQELESGWAACVHPDDYQSCCASYKKGFETKKAITLEYRMRHKSGGYRWVLDHGCPLLGENGEFWGFVGGCIDITDQVEARKLLEINNQSLQRNVALGREALEEANRHLQFEIDAKRQAEEKVREHQLMLTHVARISAIGEMAAELAHEINQPLHALNNYTKGALRNLGRDSWQNHDFTKVFTLMEREIHRAAEIVRRVRGFAKNPTSEKELVPLTQVIDDSIQFVDFEIQKKKVQVYIERDVTNPHVLGDIIGLEQVLLNLLRNAVEAVETLPVMERILQVKLSSTETEALLLVRDTGTGISSEAKMRLFNPFFTTKKEGLGLGLSISRRIIEEHGGSIWLESSSAEGTVFGISLPLADRKSVIPPPHVNSFQPQTEVNRARTS